MPDIPIAIEDCLTCEWNSEGGESPVEVVREFPFPMLPPATGCRFLFLTVVACKHPKGAQVCRRVFEGEGGCTRRKGGFELSREEAVARRLIGGTEFQAVFLNPGDL